MLSAEMNSVLAWTQKDNYLVGEEKYLLVYSKMENNLNLYTFQSHGYSYNIWVIFQVGLESIYSKSALGGNLWPIKPISPHSQASLFSMRTKDVLLYSLYNIGYII